MTLNYNAVIVIGEGIENFLATRTMTSVILRLFSAHHCVNRFYLWRDYYSVSKELTGHLATEILAALTYIIRVSNDW